MLSLFPELLFLAPFSAFVIRISVSIVLAHAAYKHLPVSSAATRTLGVIEGLCALLLFIGAYTQAAALVGLCIFLIHIFMPSLRPLPRSTIILALILCLSLIVTGAGPFAFDLPL
ncbi:hypothetical protein A2765_02435 [Candidatus Kaiserbacteria bacterium RIFCSPHIGHO2_01_FULL_56_24]|uniref:DoxX family protein n=1 Tax=Candidatus Kaiserbacteria bacterium RIFCSPHIGHO2_01_FULL_56_24 TaxID=1798487 RepID=A0A1F6DB43_9BACT|nr:MAG: hypothetical protein A2765_02435 [Candidatus Kaiserbacteria bacterium RIFCSPHIGHO2_01_FULL_56_24]